MQEANAVEESDEIRKEEEANAMGEDPADDHYGDDDPSTGFFRGFEDCAVDESVPAVTALPTGRGTEFAIPRSSSKCFMTMFQLQRRLGF